MTIAQLSSRIEKVKVYSAGATVTRIAELPITPKELPEEGEITGLPLAIDDSSVRVRVEVDRGTDPLACDVRIGLAVQARQETPNPPDDEEIRAAAAGVRQLQDVITLIENEISVVTSPTLTASGIVWASNSPVKDIFDFLRGTVCHGSNQDNLPTTAFYTGENAQPQSLQIDSRINIPVNHQRFNFIPITAHIKISENNLVAVTQYLRRVSRILRYYSGTSFFGYVA